MKPGWVEFAPVWGRPRVRLTDGLSEELIRATLGAALRELEENPYDRRRVRLPDADELVLNSVVYLSKTAACRLLGVNRNTLRCYAREKRWARVLNRSPIPPFQLSVYFLKQDSVRHLSNQSNIKRK